MQHQRLAVEGGGGHRPGDRDRRAAMAAVPGPQNLDTLTVATRPDGGTRRGVVISFDRTSRTATGAKPAAATQFVFLFDRSVSFDPAKFPTCARAVLEADGPDGCPPGSQVGRGAATSYPSGTADVLVFSTRYANGLRGVLITVPANGVILENTFERVTGPYGKDFRWASDELLPSALPPAERGATTRFQVSFGAASTDPYGRTHSFAERRGPAGTFGLWSRFTTGQVLLLTDRTT
ncbi:hypothetical protein [Paractinoplanes lichenicola]|nr:hypothetical protein [Actinoplanes lichenicola]